MKHLGKYEGELNLMRGLSLLVSNNPKAAREELLAATAAKNIPPAKLAVAKALLAETSSEAIKYLKQAVDGDPTSYFAQQYLASILMLLGRYDEAETHSKVAQVLFPESPVFPMLLLLSASAKGDLERRNELLEHPALKQLDDSSLEEFVAALSAFQLMQGMVVKGFDFDLSKEEFLANRELTSQAATPFVVRLAKLAVPRKGSDPTQGGNERLLSQVGITSFQRAYELLEDTISLRTFGFLITGKGDTDRIDKIIDDLQKAFYLHPDGFFMFCRGRLLYARGRLEEATQSYSIAYENPSIFPIVRQDAAYAAARCCFERFENGEEAASELAAVFLKRRLNFSIPNRKHAAVLLRIAEVSLEYESALELLPLVESGPNLSIRLGRMALACGRYDESLRHCKGVPQDSPQRALADELAAEVEKSLRLKLKELKSVNESDSASTNPL